jgi:hypothetical protein
MDNPDTQEIFGTRQRTNTEPPPLKLVAMI